MSPSINLRSGLVLTAPCSAGPGPLRSGADVSWLPRCRLGDNQGSNGACAVFSMASWAEIMHGRPISDAECLAVYNAALKQLHLSAGDGLTFGQAFIAAYEAGWLPGAQGCEMVWDLAQLTQQPLLAGYAVTDAWTKPNSAGCLDHSAPDDLLGYHAVVIAAHGLLGAAPTTTGPWVYIENSWGKAWGWNGLGILSETLHRAQIRELWTIV